MNSLFLDTSGTKIQVSLNNSKKIYKKSWTSKRNEEQKVPLALQELVKKAKIKPQQIDEIFVVTGPGHFTGLRVGVIAANMFAHFGTAKLYELSSQKIPRKITLETFEKWRKTHKPTKSVEPHYGAPPHITKTKKKVLVMPDSIRHPD